MSRVKTLLFAGDISQLGFDEGLPEHLWKDLAALAAKSG